MTNLPSRCYLVQSSITTLKILIITVKKFAVYSPESKCHTSKCMHLNFNPVCFPANINSRLHDIYECTCTFSLVLHFHMQKDANYMTACRFHTMSNTQRMVVYAYHNLNKFVIQFKPGQLPQHTKSTKGRNYMPMFWKCRSSLFDILNRKSYIDHTSHINLQQLCHATSGGWRAVNFIPRIF